MGSSNKTSDKYEHSYTRPSAELRVRGCPQLPNTQWRQEWQWCQVQAQPTKEVCDQVTRVSQHNRCTTTYSRVCTGGNRDTRDRKQERKQRKEGRRGKRSPVGILQAVLLANALSARHPIENEETCHNVPTHHCQSSPVENVVHQCKKVSDGARKCEKVPVKKCSSVTSQQCRQVCPEQPDSSVTIDTSHVW